MALVTRDQVERLAGTYSLEDLMELNGLEEIDVMFILLSNEYCAVPNPEPVDYRTEDETPKE